jgi:Protein of unknown function (DUF4238)
VQDHEDTNSVGSHTKALHEVWDEVVGRIIPRMLDLTAEDVDVLHVDLRPEMLSTLGGLTAVLRAKVERTRRAGRDLSDINVSKERQECLGEAGLERIENTAKNCAASWSRRYRERWGPKSLAALDREKNPKKPSPRSPERVDKNHYIGKSFIKNYWAVNDLMQRWRRDSTGEFVALPPDSYGKWGHRHQLYSDRLEDYFGLVEGDAAVPLRMLLESEPLNDPQRKALVGFLLVQQLRNPSFIAKLHDGMKPVVEEVVGKSNSEDGDYMRSVYETLYGNNEFYDRIARPVLWNTWVLVDCKDGFVLPDTWCVSGAGFFCAPLTPSTCFVSLPPREQAKRVLPIRICADASRAAQLNRLLVTDETKEFLSARKFEGLDRDARPSDSVLDWIRERVERVNRDVGEWT